MAGILQAKKAGYPLDMEGFCLGDKFWIIAESKTFQTRLKGIQEPVTLHAVEHLATPA